MNCDCATQVIWAILCTCKTTTDATLPLTRRTIEHLLAGNIFIVALLVPGGRCLVDYIHLEGYASGYTSNADCKLRCTRRGNLLLHGQCHLVGMVTYFVEIDLRITVYEIYPQSEKSQLTQIANCTFPYSRSSGWHC